MEDASVIKLLRQRTFARGGRKRAATQTDAALLPWRLHVASHAAESDGDARPVPVVVETLGAGGS